jgi:hypothetical protein
VAVAAKLTTAPDELVASTVRFEGRLSTGGAMSDGGVLGSTISSADPEIAPLEAETVVLPLERDVTRPEEFMVATAPSDEPQVKGFREHWELI